jgi:hypothetical protein
MNNVLASPPFFPQASVNVEISPVTNVGIPERQAASAGTYTLILFLHRAVKILFA